MDIRNIKESDVNNFDVVYHLAGISGMPACAANPSSAESINVGATKSLVKLLSKDQIIINASTTSSYGNFNGEMGYEDSVIIPVSLYGKTKYEAEKIVQDKENSVSLRFATVFGVSPKMRNDLMVNDFMYKSIVDIITSEFAPSIQGVFKKPMISLNVGHSYFPCTTLSSDPLNSFFSLLFQCFLSCDSLYHEVSYRCLVLPE